MVREFLFLILLLFTGCIDPIDFETNVEQEFLVVEADFTNEPHLNYVRISYSQPYTNPYNKLEEKALVTVTSSEGQNYQFKYDRAGYYYPELREDARGIVGHTYTLIIKIGEKSYQSSPLVLKQPVPIDSVHFKMDEQEFAFIGQRKAQLHKGYRVLVNYKDPAEQKNFFKWAFETNYEVSTQPWDYIDPLTLLPDPKGCCEQCFLKGKFEQVKVADDRLTNGKEVLNKETVFIPFEQYFGIKNKLKVYQYTTTDDAYNFFRILEQQQSSTGTIFDPPPAEAKGNIFNVNDNNEQVRGFFNVSGVTIKEITILRGDINDPFPPFRYADDCRELPGATTVIPANW